MALSPEGLRDRAKHLRHRALSALIHRTSLLTPKTVRLGHFDVQVLERGKGTPLVFLHGFADQKETWSLLGPRFADTHRVILVDLPGYGDSTLLPAEEVTLEAQVGHLGRLLEALGIREPAHLCGNSMGGALGVLMAARHPEKVASLTLLCSMGPQAEQSDLQVALDQGLNPLVPRNHDEYRDMLSWVFARKPPLPDMFWAHLADRSVERRERHKLLFQRLWDESLTWRDKIPRLEHPILLIHGRQDRIIHWTTSRAYAQHMPNARLRILDDAGHAPQWESPRQTLLEMRAFLAQVDSARRAPSRA
jgi:pimeloyl-ACP methyl ester carboxylesterase